MNSIWFDMDGTIAELYKVKDWLPALRSNDWSVYDKCLPRAHFERINAAIEALVENGWQVGVITWASKGVDWGEELNNIGNIKFNWLCRYFPALADGKFACIPYGCNKAKYLTEMNDSHLYHLAYLVDDNKEVRADWRKFGEMRWEEGFRCKFKTIDASRSFHRAIEGLVL